MQREYLEYVDMELNLYTNRLYESVDIKTLYIGGGTPSFLSHKNLVYLSKILTKYFGDLEKIDEISFECEPNAIDLQKI